MAAFHPNETAVYELGLGMLWGLGPGQILKIYGISPVSLRIGNSRTLHRHSECAMLVKTSSELNLPGLALCFSPQG